MDYQVREQGHIANKEKVCPTCGEKGDWNFTIDKFNVKCDRCGNMISRKYYMSLDTRR